MIKINDIDIKINKFPDGSLLIKNNPWASLIPRAKTVFTWTFENNEELVTLIYLVKHYRHHGIKELHLCMPYLPNARQDRTKDASDIFTLKYFADVINWLEFESVKVLDPHSSVGEALINNLIVVTPEKYITMAGIDCTPDMLFFPDEGSMKRYAGMFKSKYAFGIKKRDWETGKIEGLDIAGDTDAIENHKILIVDDICSRGGTFLHSAKKLKELGAKEIYLYITHCENTILEGDLLTSGLIEKVYTTNSVFTKEHERIEVFELE